RPQCGPGVGGASSHGATRRARGIGPGRDRPGRRLRRGCPSVRAPHALYARARPTRPSGGGRVTTHPCDLHAMTCSNPGLLWCALCLVVVAGCGRRAATRADCEAILDRIVELELREQGFDDPPLEARTKSELREQFAASVAACEGKPLHPEALHCVGRAQSTEVLSHDCLGSAGPTLHAA